MPKPLAWLILLLILAILLAVGCTRNKCGNDSLFGEDSCHWVTTATYTKTVLYDSITGNSDTLPDLDKAAEVSSGILQLSLNFHDLQFLIAFDIGTAGLGDTVWYDDTSRFGSPLPFEITKGSVSVSASKQQAFVVPIQFENVPDDLGPTNGTKKIYAYQIKWDQNRLSGDLVITGRYLRK